MNRSCQESRFSRRLIAAHPANELKLDVPFSEILPERPTRIVVTKHADWKWQGTQRLQVVNGVRSTTGKDSRLSVIKYQNWCLARNAGDLAENKLVGHQVSINSNRTLGK